MTESVLLCHSNWLFLSKFNVCFEIVFCRRNSLEIGFERQRQDNVQTGNKVQVQVKQTLLFTAKISFLFMHQSIPAAPRPPSPRATAEHLPALSAPGEGHLQIVCCPGICQPRGHSRAFVTSAVSYQNITTQMILLGKKADWLICHGQEKIEEGVKAFSWFYACIFSLLIKARITLRHRELSTWINVFWLLSQISVDIVGVCSSNSLASRRGTRNLIFILAFILLNFLTTSAYSTSTLLLLLPLYFNY